MIERGETMMYNSSKKCKPIYKKNKSGRMYDNMRENVMSKTKCYHNLEEEQRQLDTHKCTLQHWTSQQAFNNHEHVQGLSSPKEELELEEQELVRKTQKEHLEEKQELNLRNEQEEQEQEEQSLLKRQPNLKFHNVNRETEMHHIVDVLQEITDLRSMIDNVSSSCQYCKSITEELTRSKHTHCDEFAELFADIEEFANSYDTCVEGIVKREIVQDVLPRLKQITEQSCSTREDALHNVIDTLETKIESSSTLQSKRLTKLEESMHSLQDTLANLQFTTEQNAELINALTNQVQEHELQQQQQQQHNRAKRSSSQSEAGDTEKYRSREKLSNTDPTLVKRDELIGKLSEVEYNIKTTIKNQIASQLSEPLKLLDAFANERLEKEQEMELRVLERVVAQSNVMMQKQTREMLNSYKEELTLERQMELHQLKQDVEKEIHNKMHTIINKTESSITVSSKQQQYEQQQQHRQEEQFILVDVRVAALQKSIHILEGALTNVCGELQEVRTDLRKSETSFNAQLAAFRNELERLESYHEMEQREHQQSLDVLSKQSNLNSSFYELRDWLSDLEKRVVSQGELREKLTPIEQRLAELQQATQLRFPNIEKEKEEQSQE